MLPGPYQKLQKMTNYDGDIEQQEKQKVGTSSNFVLPLKNSKVIGMLSST